jgi:hypothetical protein
LLGILFAHALPAVLHFLPIDTAIEEAEKATALCVDLTFLELHDARRC